jgi:hypothetical protein
MILSTFQTKIEKIAQCEQNELVLGGYCSETYCFQIMDTIEERLIKPVHTQFNQKLFESKARFIISYHRYKKTTVTNNLNLAYCALETASYLNDG